MNVDEVLDYFGKDAGAFAEFIDRYIEGPIMAQDLQPGQLSSAELAKFKQYPPQKQNQVIKLLERIGFYQTRDPAKAKELQAQLDRLSQDARPYYNKWPPPDWLNKKFGSNNWVKAYRWTDKLKEKYDRLVTPKEYEEAQQEWRKEQGLGASDQQPVKAAGVIFKTSKGEVLLVERSAKGDHSGEWAFPGGVTEAGESPDETAAREAEEEVGYYPNELEPFHHHVLDGVDFTTFVQDVDAPFEPKINNESSKAAWHSLGDLPTPLHPGVAKMLDEKLLATDGGPGSGPRAGAGKSAAQRRQENFHNKLKNTGEPQEKFYPPHPEDWKKKFPNWEPSKDSELEAEDEELPTKLSQEEVHYGPGKGATRCDHCMNFLTEGPHCEVVEGPITAEGWCDRFAAQEENAIAEDSQFDGLIINSDHDGPWMSCMSKDGRTMYRNKNVPEQAKIGDKLVSTDEILLHHEVPEWEEIQELLAEFKVEHNREPNVSERKQIYLKAHHSSGTPQEREYCKANNIDWDAWSAWCRGQEAKVERLKLTNPPPDEDVKPIPHGHGDLEITMDAREPGKHSPETYRRAAEAEAKRGQRFKGMYRIEMRVKPGRESELPNYLSRAEKKGASNWSKISAQSGVYATREDAEAAVRDHSAKYPHMEYRVAQDTALDVQFKEEDHPRGNSKNAGQFSKGGGSSSKAPQKPIEKANGASKSEKGGAAHPEAKNAPTGSSELRSFLKGKLSEADLDQALSLINKERPEKPEHGEHKEHRSPKEHVQRIQEFFKQPNVAKNISQSVQQLLKHHGKGLAEHTFNHNLVLPAVHTALALTLGHMGATVPEIVATNVAGYALHQLAHHVGFHPKGAMKALKFVVKHLLDAHKIGELKAAVGGEDAAPEKEDDIGASLQRLLDILDKHSPEDLIKNAKPPADLEDEPKSEDGALGVDSYLAMDRGISSLLSEQQLQYLNARQGIAFDRNSVRELDTEGRMHVAVSNISKANICPYVGYEIPQYQELGLDPEKIYQLLRDPDELKKAAPTFNGIQLLRRHIPVSVDDHQPYDVVGTTGTDAEFVFPYLRNSLIVWTKEGIDAINSEEKRELSCAYRYRADMTPGTFEGQPYQGVMRDIAGNHVSIVESGRAGADICVMDSLPEELGWVILFKAPAESKAPSFG